MKLNVTTKEEKIWSLKEHFPSEPVFIPKPGSQLEDEGVVLSAIISETCETDGFLLFLDGQTFAEIARAKFSSPSALTTDFHGVFVAST